MKLPDDLRSFLSTVEGFNDQYNALVIAGDTQSLTHCFWSIPEIEGSGERKAEWGVPGTQIPFYGDWHEVMCIDADSQRIVYLNDSREVMGEWESPEVFIASLCFIQEEKRPTDGIIEEESHLDF